MQIVNVHEAETHLSRLLEAVASGEEVIITRADVPVARLVALHPEKKSRVPGALKGRLHIAEDFDAPLPEALSVAFRGETL